MFVRNPFLISCYEVYQCQNVDIYELISYKIIFHNNKIMKKVKSKELNDVKKTGGKYAHFERTLLVKENEMKSSCQKSYSY